MIMPKELLKIAAIYLRDEVEGWPNWIERMGVKETPVKKTWSVLEKQNFRADQLFRTSEKSSYRFSAILRGNFLQSLLPLPKNVQFSLGLCKSIASKEIQGAFVGYFFFITKKLNHVQKERLETIFKTLRILRSPKSSAKIFLFFFTEKQENASSASDSSVITTFIVTPLGKLPFWRESASRENIGKKLSIPTFGLEQNIELFAQAPSEKKNYAFDYYGPSIYQKIELVEKKAILGGFFGKKKLQTHELGNKYYRISPNMSGMQRGDWYYQVRFRPAKQKDEGYTLTEIFRLKIFYYILSGECEKRFDGKIKKIWQNFKKIFPKKDLQKSETVELPHSIIAFEEVQKSFASIKERIRNVHRYLLFTRGKKMYYTSMTVAFSILIFFYPPLLVAWKSKIFLLICVLLPLIVGYFIQYRASQRFLHDYTEQNIANFVQLWYKGLSQEIQIETKRIRERLNQLELTLEKLQGQSEEQVESIRKYQKKIKKDIQEQNWKEFLSEDSLRAYIINQTREDQDKKLNAFSILVDEKFKNVESALEKRMATLDMRIYEFYRDIIKLSKENVAPDKSHDVSFSEPTTSTTKYSSFNF